MQHHHSITQCWVVEAPMTFYNSLPLHSILAAICDSAKDRPDHSLMLSSHLLGYLPLHLVPGTVPWSMVLARPYHLILNFLTLVNRSSYGLVTVTDLQCTSLFVTWSLYEIWRILQKCLISMACNHFCRSQVRVHVSHTWHVL